MEKQLKLIYDLVTATAAKKRKQIRGVKSKSLNSFGFGLDFPSECSALQSDQSKTQ